MTALEAEAVGMKEALVWASMFPDRPVVVESDAQVVVNAIQRHTLNHLEVGIVLQECQAVLSGRNNIRLVNVKRLANKAAHLLARLPCSLLCVILPSFNEIFCRSKKRFKHNNLKSCN